MIEQLPTAPEKIKLHIGGTEQKEGWKILNKLDAPYVDYNADLNDLSEFPDECCNVIYGSHVFEHIGQQNMPNVMKQVKRILAPDGMLMISVPDLDILCKLFTDPELDYDAKFYVMCMMFGGQLNKYDFHYIGLNFDILSRYLKTAGFKNIFKVDKFDIFHDTSYYAPFKNQNISLNVIALNY